MSKLTASDRNKLPDSAFAGPDRSYPVPDARHAQNAKSRAEKEMHEHKLSKPEAERIEHKADKVLRKRE